MRTYYEPQGPRYRAEILEDGALMLSSSGSAKHEAWHRVIDTPTAAAIAAVDDPEMIPCWGGFISTDGKEFVAAQASPK